MTDDFTLEKYRNRPPHTNTCIHATACISKEKLTSDLKSPPRASLLLFRCPKMLDGRATVSSIVLQCPNCGMKDIRE